MRKKPVTGGYGHLRVGRGSDFPFQLSEEKRHKVKFISIGDGTITIRCSRDGCKFRIRGLTSLEDAERHAAEHIFKYFHE